MATRTLRRKLDRLEAKARTRRSLNTALLAQLRDDPARIMALAGKEPDPWQEQVLRSAARQMLLLASRQSGKSETAAALALKVALLRPRSLVLLLSPSLRQSGELFRKVRGLFNALGRPMPVLSESVLQVEFVNGSRIIALPSTEATIRCYSGVALLVIDEAARVPDPLYFAVRPMLAESQGQMVALSTPFGKRGWFHDAWHGGAEWERVQITAEQCPRIPAAFLAEERRALGERYFSQEYLTIFTDCVGAVFSWADIQASLSDDIKPLF